MIATNNAVKSRELFNKEEENFIFKRSKNNKTTSSRKEIDSLKNDKAFKRVGGIHESDFLSSNFMTKSFPKDYEKHLRNWWNQLEEQGLSDKNKLTNTLVEIKKSEIDDLKNRYHLSEEEAINGVTRDFMNNTGKAEYLEKFNGNPTTSTVFLQKSKPTEIGVPSHEVGHAIEEAHSDYTPCTFFDKDEVLRLKNELRYTGNHAGPIQQLGNEGMASLRGISRYRGEDKEQATKNLLDNYATYINNNGEDIIRGIW